MWQHGQVEQLLPEGDREQAMNLMFDIVDAGLNAIYFQREWEQTRGRFNSHRERDFL
jgi:hypothetical protein